MTDEELIKRAREKRVALIQAIAEGKPTIWLRENYDGALASADEALLRAASERDVLRDYKYQNEIQAETLRMQSEDISQKEKRIEELEAEVRCLDNLLKIADNR